MTRPGVQQLRTLARELPVVIREREDRLNGEIVYEARAQAMPARLLVQGRYPVLAAYLQGWIDARHADAPATSDLPPG